MPKTNKAFWRNKFKANVARDAEHERVWSETGWNLIVIWTCGLKTEKNKSTTFKQLAKCLTSFSK